MIDTLETGIESLVHGKNLWGIYRTRCQRGQEAFRGVSIGAKGTNAPRKNSIPFSRTEFAGFVSGLQGKVPFWCPIQTVPIACWRLQDEGPALHRGLFAGKAPRAAAFSG